MLRLGVDEYIVKPFNTTELITRIFNLLVKGAERKKYLESIVPEKEALPDNAAADELREKIRSAVVDKISKVDLSIAEVAESLQLSERQLFRYAKSLTGSTPAQLIKEIRLLTAYDLLVTGEVQKLEDLARRVGYEHLSYFSKQFMERFGRRPTEFMKG
jgi:AraC-like DNA-binding protein